MKNIRLLLHSMTVISNKTATTTLFGKVGSFYVKYVSAFCDETKNIIFKCVSRGKVRAE